MIKKLFRALRWGDHPLLPWTVIGRGNDPYMTRVFLTPRLPFGGGQLLLHVFHRGDGDPDPHDHPWSFWTIPLTTYEEEVLEYVEGRLTLVNQRVEALKAHYRPATYIHRVLGKVDDWGAVHPGSFCTLVWTRGWERSWGFWPRVPGARIFVSWRAYFKFQKDQGTDTPNWIQWRHENPGRIPVKVSRP